MGPRLRSWGGHGRRQRGGWQLVQGPERRRYGAGDDERLAMRPTRQGILVQRRSFKAVGLWLLLLSGRRGRYMVGRPRAARGAGLVLLSNVLLRRVDPLDRFIRLRQQK